MKEQQHSTTEIKNIKAKVIKVSPIQKKQQKRQQKSKQIKSELNDESIEISSNSMKHKLPQVILKYIMEQAKQKRGDIGTANKTNTNKFLRAASKITQNKKLQSKYVTSKCQICSLDVAERQMESISSCEHKYCASCLHQYVIYKITSFQAVECPHEGCQNLLSEQTKCYTQLPLDARKKYKKYKQYSETLKKPGLKLCPNEDCEGFLQLDSGKPSQEGTIVISGPKCTKCGKVYCPECLFEAHEGECDPHQLSFFQVTLHYRQCTKCKNVIQKSSGCNHMTCVCGYQFCYVCGGKWSDHHICNNPQSEPVFNQVQCDCCCCSCDLVCCQCCQEASNTVSQCCDNCCQSICQNCCAPICNGLQNCCQCCQCCQQKCQCCSSAICTILGKGSLVLIIILLLIPTIFIQLIFMVFFRILMGIALGLFGFYCLLEDQGIEYEWYHVVIAILILPVTLCFFMFLGLKSVFNQEGVDQLGQILCIPFEVISNICSQ